MVSYFNSWDPQLIFCCWAAFKPSDARLLAVSLAAGHRRNICPRSCDFSKFSGIYKNDRECHRAGLSLFKVLPTEGGSLRLPPDHAIKVQVVDTGFAGGDGVDVVVVAVS